MFVNKETTYLLTYLLLISSESVRGFRSPRWPNMTIRVARWTF